MLMYMLIVSMVCLILWGNGSTIIAFIIRKNLRKNPSYWFIVSLSLMDFLTGLLVAPFTAYWYWEPSLRTDQTICDINAILHLIFTAPTVHHLMIISADRYFKLVSPLKYKTTMTLKRAAIILTFLWLLEIVVAILAVIPDHYFKRNCFTLNYVILESNIHYFPALLTTFLISLPLMFLVYFSIRTYMIASNFNQVVSRELSIRPGNDRVYIRYKLGKIMVEKCDSSCNSNGQSFRGKNILFQLQRLINSLSQNGSRQQSRTRSFHC